MKKSITKYHQRHNKLIIRHLWVILGLKKASPSITKYHQLFLAVIPYRFAAIYSFYIRSLVSMLLRFILQVSIFRLHPDVQTLYTPMYTVCRSGCIIPVHPGVWKVLQGEANYLIIVA